MDLSTLTKLLLGGKTAEVTAIEFSHSIFPEEQVGTEFNKESVARDTLYTVFARQTRARAVHMDRICRRRCAHVRGTCIGARRAAPHVRTRSMHAEKTPSEFTMPDMLHFSPRFPPRWYFVHRALLDLFETLQIRA